ncbi:hypothetical protein, partial [Stieleria sp.]|uniref:hypothetical protein n=1 Tax=Stieleria sp. TaxID=2795976 RepID=UPI003566FB38
FAFDAQKTSTQVDADNPGCHPSGTRQRAARGGFGIKHRAPLADATCWGRILLHFKHELRPRQQYS